jgi:hypothetical protein
MIYHFILATVSLFCTLQAESAYEETMTAYVHRHYQASPTFEQVPQHWLLAKLNIPNPSITRAIPNPGTALKSAQSIFAPQFQDNSTIMHPLLANKLELFAHQSSATQDLFTTFLKPHIHGSLGIAAMIGTLINPTNDAWAIVRSQHAIAYFLEHPDVHEEIGTILAELAQSEKFLF